MSIAPPQSSKRRRKRPAGVAAPTLLALGAALWAALLSAPGAARAGETYHSATGNYSVSIPDGWTAISPAALARVQAADKTGVVDQEFVAPEDSPPPRALFYLHHHDYLSGRQFLLSEQRRYVYGARTATTTGNPTGAQSQSGSVALGSTVVLGSKFDESTHRFEIEYLRGSARGLTHEFIFGAFGGRDVAMITMLCSEADRSAMHARFAAVARTLTFDPSAAYDPSRDHALIKILVGGVCVIGVAAAAIVFFVLRLRRRPALPAFASIHKA